MFMLDIEDFPERINGTSQDYGSVAIKQTTWSLELRVNQWFLDLFLKPRTLYLEVK